MAQGTDVQELLARVGRRDRESLGELYERFAPQLLGMVLQILTDRGAAKEVLESVFLRLWKEARRFNPASASLAAWLAITARRQAIDRLRNLRKLPPLICDVPGSMEKSMTWLPSPEEIQRLEGRSDLLKRVVNQLPEPQRRILNSVVFEGYTEHEIAGQLGKPLAGVKAGLRAALTFLRHRLRAVSGTWAANI